MGLGDAVLHALEMAFTMFWDILWALVLGFSLSAIIEAVVSKSEISRLLPNDSPKCLTVASALGAASSSCSYAAVALARSLFRKGANFTAAMAFEVASTNLVLELGIILIVLMGWQFALAEFAGAPMLIAVMALLFRVFLTRNRVAAAKQQADRGLAGRMEGHAGMDMSITEGPLLQRLVSAKGFTAISHYFVMNWASVAGDIVIGLLLAGAIGAWVPTDFWQGLFLQSHPLLAALWGPVIGPVVAILSFVCSVGNVPLAAILWNSGISFGGIIAFLYADLLIIPILNIYRKYYGGTVAAVIFGSLYAASIAAAYVIEVVFRLLHLIPKERVARIMEAHISWNYTTFLNLLFLALALLFSIRFFKTGGPEMMKMMNNSPDDHHQHHGNHH